MLLREPLSISSFVISGNCFLFFPKTACDVFKYAGCGLLVESLVGGLVFQTAKMSEIGTELEVIEIVLVEKMWEILLATVPSHLVRRVLPVKPYGQTFHFLRVVVATHEADAGDVAAELADHLAE